MHKENTENKLPAETPLEVYTKAMLFRNLDSASTKWTSS